MQKYILAIDPGNELTAFTVIDAVNLHPVRAEKVTNDELLSRIKSGEFHGVEDVAIEMIASYGMPVGATVFDTCVWIGRFQQALTDKGSRITRVFRKEVKMHICGSPRAKDGNVRQALIDRFGGVGTKKEPGWFFGFKADMWAAYAVAVTHAEAG